MRPLHLILWIKDKVYAYGTVECDSCRRRAPAKEAAQSWKQDWYDLICGDCG